MTEDDEEAGNDIPDAEDISIPSSVQSGGGEEWDAVVRIRFDHESEERMFEDTEQVRAVVLSPAEAREVADHLADYDITAQLSDKEDGRPVEAVEWADKLRKRARNAREEDDG